MGVEEGRLERLRNNNWKGGGTLGNGKRAQPELKVSESLGHVAKWECMGS